MAMQEIQNQDTPSEGECRFNIPGGFFDYLTFFLVRMIVRTVHMKEDVASHEYSLLIDCIEYFHRKYCRSELRWGFVTVNAALPFFYSFKMVSTVGKNISSYGRSFTSKEEAVSKAIGEFLERFFLSGKSVASSKIKSTWISASHVSRIPILAHLPTYFAWQKKYLRRAFVSVETFMKDGGKGFECLPVESLLTQKTEYVPTQLLFWSEKVSRDEPLLRHQTTNGGGGGFTLAEATLSGLYEVVERDAFLIYWLNGIAPNRIHFGMGEYPRYAKRIIEEVEQKGYTLVFLDVTADTKIPTVAAILLGKTERGVDFLTLGMACGLQTEKLLLKAALEAFSIANETRASATTSWIVGDDSFSDTEIGKSARLQNVWVGSQVKNNISFFLGAESIEYLEWLKKNPANGMSFNAEEECTMAARMVHTLGNEYGDQAAYAILRYTVSHRMLTELGYSVVRIIVPAFLPLYLTETFVTLNAKRLREVPQKLGYIAKKPDAYVKIPHPIG